MINVTKYHENILSIYRFFEFYISFTTIEQWWMYGIEYCTCCNYYNLSMTASLNVMSLMIFYMWGVVEFLFSLIIYCSLFAGTVLFHFIAFWNNQKCVLVYLIDGAKLEYRSLVFSHSEYMVTITGIPEFQLMLWYVYLPFIFFKHMPSLKNEWKSVRYWWFWYHFDICTNLWSL